ncbi:MAG: acetoacetate decarboxylase family protein [Chloroflexota bacterium]
MEKRMTTEHDPEVERIPPPWELTGEGFIFVIRPGSEGMMQRSFIPPFLHEHYRGGPGAVMLVDYHTSPVGPYQEALYIPGLFDYAARRLFSITRILVSTMISVVNGRENWGIPKDLADFNFDQYTGNARHITMKVDHRPALDVLVETRTPYFSFNTRWLPFRPGLVQQHQDRALVTRPYGRGRVALADLRRCQVDPEIFPDFGQHQPLLAAHARDFRLTFPVAEQLMSPVYRHDA